METKKVYLQTDIGGDIDDFWALVMLLKQPWLDLRMILTDTGNTVYRAAICAKLLQLAGRGDVVVGAGLAEWPDARHPMSHLDWVKDYPLASYPNYTQNGIDRFVDMVRAEDGPVTLVAIGPVPSLAAALRKAPDIARKIDFVGMFGSVYRGYSGHPRPDAEYNVYMYVEDSKAVFSADWRSATITPLDTCGLVKLEGDLYGRIAASADSCHQWAKTSGLKGSARRSQSTISRKCTWSGMMQYSLAVSEASSRCSARISACTASPSAESRGRFSPFSRRESACGLPARQKV